MCNILVCDDDKEIVKAIEIYLVKENYNVLKAYNGEECLKILKENIRYNDAKKRWNRNNRRNKEG